MFLVNWFYSAMESMGLYMRSGRIVLLGLDNAGKTTLMHLLTKNQLKQHNPTQNPTMEQATIGNVQFNLFDLGGHEIARRLWSDYYQGADAVVFLVDAKDTDRLEESAAMLHYLLEDDSIASTPILILGNKIDSPYALSGSQIEIALGLTPYLNSNTYNVKLCMCSLVKKMGYREGFLWLSKLL